MESNLNKIKNLMQEDTNQPLPPELGWDNMKEGIFDKIQSLEQAKSSPKDHPQSWKRMGFFLSLFFLLTLGLYSVFHKMIPDQNPEAYDVVKVPTTPKNESGSSEISKSAPTKQPAYSAEVLVEEIGKKDAEDPLLTYGESEPAQAPRKSERLLIDTGQSLAYQQRPEHEPSTNHIPAMDRMEAAQSTPDTVQKAAGLLEETRSSDVMPFIPELLTLSPYGFDHMGLEKRNHSILDTQKADSVSLPDIYRSKSPNQLILEGGLTFWEEGYGNSNPERAQYEAPIPSFQLQGYYMHSLKGSYFVMAGLQYQQLESKLSYDNTIQDYKITLTDTVIQVQNNLLTGEQNIIRGDVEEFVQAERRVRHYNKTQLFKASLAVGKHWRFNSLQTDVYLGAAMNSWVRNQGRMFSENTIIDYNGASNSFFSNQWTVDGVLGVRLHYLLLPNIGLTTGFQTQRSLMNWSNRDDINFYPVSFSLQVGVSYSLY